MAATPHLMTGAAVCLALWLGACHAPESPTGSDVEAVGQQTYHPSLVMVRMAPGRSLRATARAKGARLLQDPRDSGYGLVEVPLGQAPARFAALLRGDPEVADVQPVGIVRGAAPAKQSYKVGAHPLQWQLPATGTPLPGTCNDAVGGVVAILDTGVAYESFDTFVRVPSLDCVSFYAPYDFVNDDLHPNDDNQHGTLMASLVASAAPDLAGIAPGVAIMPIKVLDADNLGLETDLVDGIHHAIDNHADVISLSLSFGPGYVPSPPLLDALQRAHDAGVVVVAAAGNEGRWAARWPAASPLTVSVAAGRPGAWDTAPDALWDGDTYSPTSYTNLHPMVDVVAPGGSLAFDRTGSGYPDGVVSEGIDPDDPTRVGLWLSAGTSQATAITSGSVAHLLAAGAPAPDVARYLHAAASWNGLAGEPFVSGQGGGVLKTPPLVALGSTPPAPALDLAGSVMPYMIREGNQLRPVAEVTVVDGTGSAYSGGSAIVTFSGSTTASMSCVLVDGRCSVMGPAADPSLTSGAVAWMASLDAVRVGNVAYRPTGLLFASDAFEILWTSLLDGLPQATLLAFYWENKNDAVYGKLAEGYTVVDSGSGFASSPIGLTFTPQVFTGAVTTEDLWVDFDATGLASSPIGLGLLRLVHIDGTGLASSPIGSAGFASSPIGMMSDVLLAAFDGTGLASSAMSGSGLASSPIGLSSLDIYSFGDGSYDSDWLYLDQDAVMLATGASPTVELTSTNIGMLLDSGGWVLDGYQGASLLGTGATDNVAETSAMAGVLPLVGGAP